GKFNEERALAYCAKYFGPLKKPANPLETIASLEPAQDGERNVVLRRVGTIGAAAAFYNVPAAPHPDYPPPEGPANVLGTTPSGRLYKELIAAKKSSGAAAFAWPTHGPGMFLTLAQVDKGQSADAIRQNLIDVVETLATKKVTAEEIDHSRAELTN